MKSTMLTLLLALTLFTSCKKDQIIEELVKPEYVEEEITQKPEEKPNNEEKPNEEKPNEQIPNNDSEVGSQGPYERVIFDTDPGGDVDDAGALAVLHALADRGEVKILAIGVC